MNRIVESLTTGSSTYNMSSITGDAYAAQAATAFTYDSFSFVQLQGKPCSRKTFFKENPYEKADLLVQI